MKTTSSSSTSKTKKPLPSWDALTFSLTETDYMYRSFGDSSRPVVWDRGEMVPFAAVSHSPSAAFMSYGLGVFEGLKAQKCADGRILIFRPDRNAARFRRSAERLLMPPFPAEQFLSALDELLRRNARFVPPADKGSFYIRPVEHAIEPKLGLGPCHLFGVIIFGSPVGSYFAGGAPLGIRLKVLEQGRVPAGGTGFAKAMGNYAGGIYIAHEWKEKGFDDVLYLDARHVRYVTETSGSNVFIQRKDGTIVTPPLDDQILPGVTRESTIQIARDVLKIRVEERPLPIEEVIEEGEEMFCTGTAWTLQGIREIVYRDRTCGFRKEETRKALLEILRGIQTGAREDPFGWVREVKLD
jgi:branched-chain amino acid aminotransferase